MKIIKIFLVYAILSVQVMCLQAMENHDELVNYEQEFIKRFVPQDIQEYCFKTHTGQPLALRYKRYIDLIIVRANECEAITPVDRDNDPVSYAVTTVPRDRYDVCYILNGDWFESNEETEQIIKQYSGSAIIENIERKIQQEIGLMFYAPEFDDVQLDATQHMAKRTASEDDDLSQLPPKKRHLRQFNEQGT